MERFGKNQDLEDYKYKLAANKKLFELSEDKNFFSEEERALAAYYIDRAMGILNDDAYPAEIKLKFLKHMDDWFDANTADHLGPEWRRNYSDLETKMSSFLKVVDQGLVELEPLFSQIDQVFEFFGDDIASALLARLPSSDATYLANELSFALMHKEQVKETLVEIKDTYADSPEHPTDSDKYTYIFSKLKNVRLLCFFPQYVIESFTKFPESAEFPELGVSSGMSIFDRDVNSKRNKKLYKFLDMLGDTLHIDPESKTFDADTNSEFFRKHLYNLMDALQHPSHKGAIQKVIENLVKNSGGHLVVDADFVATIDGIPLIEMFENRASAAVRYSELEYPLSVKLINCLLSDFSRSGKAFPLAVRLNIFRQGLSSDEAYGSFLNLAVDVLDDISGEEPPVRDKQTQRLQFAFDSLKGSIGSPFLLETAERFAKGEGSEKYFPFVTFIQRKAPPLLDEILDVKTDDDLAELIGKVKNRLGYGEDFNPGDEQFYRDVFEFLDKAGLGWYHDFYISRLNFDPYLAEIKDSDTLTIMKIAENIKKNIHPKIASLILLRCLANIDFEEFALEELRPLYHEDSGKFDLTPNSIETITKALLMLSAFSDIKRFNFPEIFKRVFPNCECGDSADSAIKWFVRNIDLGETVYQKISSLNLYTEYMGLMNFFMSYGTDENKSDYLAKIQETDITLLIEDGMLSEKISEIIYSSEALEKFRQDVNRDSSKLGDMLIARIGESFLENTEIGHDTLPEYLKFARAWGGVDVYSSDVAQMYKDFSTFAYDAIAAFIGEKLAKEEGEDELEEELERHEIDLDDVLEELEEGGFSIVKQSNLSKLATRIFTDPGYVFRKGYNKAKGLLANDVVDVKDLSYEKVGWPSRSGVEVTAVLKNGVEQAKLFKFDPSTIQASVLLNQEGMVDMDAEAKRLGDSLVFAAPLSMTTGSRKLTEIAFRDGAQLNWLTGKKEGYVLVSSDGLPKVLDKTSLKIGELLDEGDLENPVIKNALEKWAKKTPSVKGPEEAFDSELEISSRYLDRSLFYKILAEKNYSLLVNLLVLKEGRIQPIKDGADSRRLFLTYPGGSFGVLNSSIGLSTNVAASIAAQSGAEKAVYMDTGMYDMASYVDGAGKEHVVGHQDTNLSSNRLVISAR